MFQRRTDVFYLLQFINFNQTTASEYLSKELKYIYILRSYPVCWYLILDIIPEFIQLQRAAMKVRSWAIEKENKTFPKDPLYICMGPAQCLMLEVLCGYITKCYCIWVDYAFTCGNSSPICSKILEYGQKSKYIWSDNK